MINAKLTGVRILISIFCCILFGSAAQAQTTAFSYQGRLTEAGSPANGTRYFRFTLFDENGAAIPGASVEQTLTVANGVFNTSLDFGASNFPGANRSLQIEVKINAGDAYTVLNPRQNILSSPYSIKSKSADNSTQLGGLNASRYVQQDAGGNVSVGGNLTVNGAVSYNTVNAQTQYNLGGERILSNPGNFNLFVGRFAGISNTGSGNTFVGAQTGRSNLSGTANSFFGAFSGDANTTGNNNSFFGTEAGPLTTTGSDNSFFGVETGKSNVAGNGNSFFGRGAGRFNTASGNSFFGNFAGYANSTGDLNSFFGADAGKANTTGDRNAFFGIEAGLNNTTGCCNSFFGNKAGLGNTTGRGNTFAGGSAGRANTTGERNAFFGDLSGTANTTGSNNVTLGSQANFGADNLIFAAAIGANSVVGTSDTIVLGKTAGNYFNPATQTLEPRPADTVLIPGNLNIAGNLTGGGIVKSVNGLTGNLNLAAGANVTITPSGNTLTIASTGGGGGCSGGGTCTASVFNATQQFNWNGLRILTIGGPNNLYVGLDTGFRNVSGADNTFVGNNAGKENLTGSNNSFFGGGAGVANQSGGSNSFFGTNAGSTNGTGNFNSFFGADSGRSNTFGSSNTFIGSFAGRNSQTGGGNAFFGTEAGLSNQTGSRNTLLGANANVGAINLTNAAAVGANAQVSQSNSLILGGINGTNGATADTRVGIGTTAPKEKLDVTGGNILIGSPGQGIVLKSPDGATCKLLSIDNSGAIVLTAVTCP